MRINISASTIGYTCTNTLKIRIYQVHFPAASYLAIVCSRPSGREQTTQSTGTLTEIDEFDKVAMGN